MARAHWLAFFAGLAAAWVLLFLMAASDDLRSLQTIYGVDFIAAICGGTLGDAGALSAIVMWALMSAAMMAPTALPALATYDDLGHVARTGFGALVAGYLVVWLGFSVVAAFAQVALFQAGVLGASGQSLSPPLSATLLIGAGLYQFSSLKDACLSRCRAPLAFFIQHWDEGPFRNGLRMGMDCLGCCWALMLLAFVGGTMNLAFMGLAMMLMILEKLPEIGRLVTRPLGFGLIALGVLVPLI